MPPAPIIMSTQRLWESRAWTRDVGQSVPILHRYIIESRQPLLIGTFTRKERIRSGYLIQASCLILIGLIEEGYFDLNNLIILNPDVDLMTDSFIWANCNQNQRWIMRFKLYIIDTTHK
jgi:hypothetical protein